MDLDDPEVPCLGGIGATGEGQLPRTRADANGSRRRSTSAGMARGTAARMPSLASSRSESREPTAPKGTPRQLPTASLRADGSGSSKTSAMASLFVDTDASPPRSQPSGGNVTVLPDKLVSHGLPLGNWPTSIGNAISLLSGNAELAAAVVSNFNGKNAAGIISSLASVMSRSKVPCNSEMDIRLFVH